MHYDFQQTTAGHLVSISPKTLQYLLPVLKHRHSLHMQLRRENLTSIIAANECHRHREDAEYILVSHLRKEQVIIWPFILRDESFVWEHSWSRTLSHSFFTPP